MKSNKPNNIFGENLRRIRKKKGLTQIELAELSGISRRVIGHYETQAVRPSIEKTKLIAKALGVSDNELLGITKEISQNKSYEDVSFKIMKKVRIVEKLPVRDQKAIFRLINSLAEKNKIK
jgi:transcriptional regulator with XRE-family HTH domain